MGAQGETNPKNVLERLHQAVNQHDLEAFLACFASDYRSEQPVHPNRGFGGREQVEKNWSAIFNGIPDFHAESLSTSVESDTVWTEWHWTGTQADGSLLDLRGVTLFGIRDGQIASGRLYMEEVEKVGENIDETVGRLAGHTRQAT
jgi:ketosteroid isomerase-like protein